jgi:uncharacterized ParB-like nuclease family protein
MPKVSGGPAGVAPVRPVMMTLAGIKADVGVHARVGLDHDAVEQYAEAIAAGGVFPPLDLFYDGRAYWLAGGFHRYEAYLKAGKEKAVARVRPGTKDDAAWFACAANREHDRAGLRRTNADKRRAVATALRLRPWWSNRMIAGHCGVTNVMVLKCRQLLTVSTSPGPTSTGQGPQHREGKDGKHYPASKPNKEQRATGQEGSVPSTGGHGSPALQVYAGGEEEASSPGPPKNRVERRQLLLDAEKAPRFDEAVRFFKGQFAAEDENAKATTSDVIVRVVLERYEQEKARGQSAAHTRLGDAAR